MIMGKREPDVDRREWEWVKPDSKTEENDLSPTQILKTQYICAMNGATDELRHMIAEAKDGDLTVLWALNVLNKLIVDPDRWAYEIRILTDVVRQRCVSGFLGDKTASREVMLTEHPPEFRYVIYVSFPDQPGKKMEKALVDHGFAWEGGEHRWWAWDSPERIALADAIKEECSVVKGERFL